MPLLTSSFFLVSPNPSASPDKHGQRNQIGRAYILTTAQTQYLDMIARRRIRQRQQRWRKEHRLIVRMRYQQAYPLVLQEGKPPPRGPHRVQPTHNDQKRNREQRSPEHHEAAVEQGSGAPSEFRRAMQSMDRRRNPGRKATVATTIAIRLGVVRNLG